MSSGQAVHIKVAHQVLLQHSGSGLLQAAINPTPLCQASFKQTIDLYRLVHPPHEETLMSADRKCDQVPVTDHVSGLADQVLRSALEMDSASRMRPESL